MSTISNSLVDVRTSIPCFLNCFSKATDASLSMLAIRRSAISTIVTLEPNVENACPNSEPITPPPITAKRDGTSVISKNSSLVRTLSLSIPGMLILLTLEPPAKITLSASIVSFSSTTIFLSAVRLPTPLNTLTP